MAALLSLVAALVSLVLAIQIGAPGAGRRRPCHVLWSVALLLFAIGTGAQFAAELSGWTDLLYRVWYLTGAVLTAAYLGQGSIYLLAPRRVAQVTGVVLLIASLVAAWLVFTVPVDLSRGAQDGIASGAGMPTPVRLMTPFFNVYGTVALIGGAALSAWHFARARTEGRRALGTALIALGAMVLAFGGILSRLGVPAMLYVAEVTGVIAIFAGHLQTTSRPVARTQVAAAPNLP